MSGSVGYFKMNGSGNDFVVLDARNAPLDLNRDQVRRIADRNAGVGCDQLIVLENPSEKSVDVFMRIYNADGTEAAACGNATRCIAGLLAQESGRSNIIVQTASGQLGTKVAGQNAIVDMGRPAFDWQSIPLSEEFGDTRGIELQIGPIDAPVLHTPSVVNVGNPHAVFWVDKDPDTYDLDRFGPLLENHPIFPDRANISLAQVLGPDEIKVRVWERGVGLTKACGTAACAVAVCGVRKGLTARKVKIHLPGGVLELEWRESDHHILMGGPWSLDRTDELCIEPAEADVH